jgi:hypothetical protein
LSQVAVAVVIATQVVAVVLAVLLLSHLNQLALLKL